MARLWIGGSDVNDGMIRLAVDFENPCPEWWASGGQELWDALVEAFDGNHVVVEESLADSWIREASKLPGWEGGAGVGAPPNMFEGNQR